jgi:hypothetical protein
MFYVEHLLSFQVKPHEYELVGHVAKNFDSRFFMTQLLDIL